MKRLKTAISLLMILTMILSYSNTVAFMAGEGFAFAETEVTAAETGDDGAEVTDADDSGSKDSKEDKKSDDSKEDSKPAKEESDSSDNGSDSTEAAEEEQPGGIEEIIEDETGKQAELLNQMTEIFSMNFAEFDTPEKALKVLVGHTPLQVFFGCVLGIVVGVLM